MHVSRARFADPVRNGCRAVVDRSEPAHYSARAHCGRRRRNSLFRAGDVLLQVSYKYTPIQLRR